MEHTADIGPQIMEYRPNSNPENSSAESPTEHYVMNRAINFWDGPKFINCSTKEARLRSFVIYEWPHDVIPTPDALSQTGFFAVGRNLHTILNKKTLTIYF